MTDIVLNPIANPSNTSLINDNFDKIETVVNEGLLHLEGGNNVMKQNIDMNSKSLLNVHTDVNQPNSLLTVTDGDARYYNVGGDTLTGPMNVGGNTVSGLPAPVGPTEPVRKQEFDAAIFDSAVQLRNDLANNSSPIKGAGMVGVLQDGLGAVGRTAQSKFRDIIHAKDFGVVADGETDDTAALIAALRYAETLNPNTSGFLDGRIGATIVLPAGKMQISSPLLVRQAGVRLVGQGQYATLIQCKSNFSGEAAILFEHSAVEAVFTSASVEELSVDTAGEDCHGILYNHLYDHTDCINVKISRVAVDKQAYYVRPRAGKVDPISQSLYMRGCTFYKIAAGTTPTVILQTLQEFNMVQVKIWNSHSSAVQGSSYPLELRGCRSGLLSQCSFLCTTAHGVNIIDNGRQVTSITLDTPLFENVTGGPVRAVSSNVATFPIANLQVRNPRYELPSGGEYFLDGCVRGWFETGARNVNMRSASVQNYVLLDSLDRLVITNTANTYEVLPQVTSGDHTFGVRMKIETAISPRLSLKNRLSDNEYRVSWVYDGVTDNGFQLTKYSGGVAYPLYTQPGDMLNHHFYDFVARELLRLRAGQAAGDCSMFTLYYDGATHTSKRVMAGAVGTGPGGVGRALYIAS